MWKLTYNFHLNGEKVTLKKRNVQLLSNLHLMGLPMLTKEIKQQPLWQVM